MLQKYRKCGEWDLTLKKEGQKFYDKNEVNTQLLDWIKDNIPRTKQTAHMWGG